MGVMPAHQRAQAREAETGAPLAARPLSRGDGPLYRQLVAILRRSIEERQLSAGVELPREAQLARDFGVSLITVRQALRELETEGLIVKRAAKRALVASAGRTGGAVAFQSFAEIAASTDDRRLKVLGYRKERSRHAAEALGLRAGAAMPCLRAVLHRDGEPIGETTIYFPPEIGERLNRADFDDVVVFRSVQRRLGIKLAGATITVRAETASEALGKRLDYEAGGPILTVEMLYQTTSGQPVEFTVNRNRADRFSLSYAAPNDLEV
jgi:GntR family transcriptional regulator